MTFLSKINGQKLIAVLVDPDKFDLNISHEFIKRLSFSKVDFIFVGGSTVSTSKFTECVKILKDSLTIPIIGFPGDVYQYCSELDALLYLSLLSGRNPEYLIGHHLRTAKEIQKEDFETIPTAYLLIDGGHQSATAYVSQTQAIPQNQIDIIERTAIAGVLQGKQLLYLDSGSGAIQSVKKSIIQACSKLNVPLIIGGGIRTLAQIEEAHESGANLVVIGNHLEENSDFLLDLHSYKINEK
jgi:phosphoglycerol geranylgeranyltransferase